MGKPNKKSKTGSLLKAPWQISKKMFETFELITPKNKDKVIVMGRIIYTIEVMGEKYRQYRGFNEIAPRLSKGRLYVKNHEFFPDYNVYIRETESIDEYKRRYAQIHKNIEAGMVYFRPEDELIKYARG